MSTFIEYLPCRLSDAEVLQKSAQLTQKMAEHDLFEMQMKEQAAENKKKLVGMRTEFTALGREVRYREESRPVECSERKRFGDLMVDVVRLDTGEVIRSRPMEQHERQATLDDITEIQRPRQDPKH